MITTSESKSGILVLHIFMEFFYTFNFMCVSNVCKSLRASTLLAYYYFLAYSILYMSILFRLLWPFSIMLHLLLEEITNHSLNLNLDLVELI